MKDIIFEGFGLRIVQSEHGLIAEYDSGQSSGSHLVRKKVSAEQAERAAKSEESAYLVLLEIEDDPTLSY